MYSLVIGTAALAVFIALGLFYRIAIIGFFLSFTYLELIDKSWYLNHYYFVSLIAFLLVFLPANQSMSIDSLRLKHSDNRIPRWSILCIQCQVATVYFFAGIAKIKYDWLILAQPMDIWLNARTHIPVIGSLFSFDVTPYIFSWAGMIYDLTIPFFLFWRRTRFLAFFAVVVFHVLTHILFNIGMFPWIMIGSALIFFDRLDWKKIFPGIQDVSSSFLLKPKRWIQIPLAGYFALQFFLPLRHHLFEGNVLENEKGFRFAWHVMVMEKNGHVEYQLTDEVTGKTWSRYPSEELTLGQEKQMSFQRDMLIQYGKHLKKEYYQQTGNECSITAKNWTALNGRPSKITVYSAKDFN